MAGGNHPKSSSFHRKSRWETNSSAAPATTKSPSESKPKPNNPNNPNPNNPKPNPSPKHPTDHPALIPFHFPEPGPPPPPAYGFHMLERRTIILADGSVRSYFALPPDYQDFAPPPSHLDRFDLRFPPRHPDYRNPMEPSAAKRKYGGDEDGRDELSRQREQLLRNANNNNLNGFARVPGGEFSAGPGGPLKRDFTDPAELRPSKHSRVDGVGSAGNNNNSTRHALVDQGALKKAFLHFVKLINDNASQKKSYLEDGKQGRLLCVACGSGSGGEPLLLVEESEEMWSQNLKKKKELPLPLPEGILGEIVHLAKNLPQNLTLEEALAVYEGRVSEKECLEVLEILGEEEEHHLVLCCLYFFQWMRSQEPSLVTPRACTLLFPLLGRAKMGDKLMVLFRNLPSNKEFRDACVYNAAISGLLSSGRYEDAWKVYESMEKDDIHPDHVTCTIMITVMRKLGHSAKDAWQFFEKMNTKGVGWSEEVLGALIKSFCIEGLLSEALIIQSEMEKNGVSSNAIVYNTMMDAYCKSNRVEEAEGLFVEMRAKGIKPTAATFNILMHAYSRRMQPKIVENLLAEMQDAGLKPNAISYTCLISAYGRQKKMSDMAADAFLKMEKVGIKPTSQSYTALIHAYSISGWHEKAYLAFENMRREGLKPSIETYTTLLDAFRRAGDAQTLMKIWKLMMSEKVVGTPVTFNILVDGFAKQGQYMEARDVISEFGKVGLQPTVMTYNMLMNAYARGGQHSKLPQLLNEMAAHNLKPDSVTYSTMIYAFVCVQDFKHAFFCHKQMVKSGQVMDYSSYQKLRALLEVKAGEKNRKDRIALLGIIKSKMLIMKDKRKKDEFWKYKKRHVKKT